MDVERETVVIAVLIAAVLAPLWFFALSTAEAEEPVELTEGGIVPNERVVDTPVAVNELVAGVITWIGLAGLVGLIVGTHGYVHSRGRPDERVAANGGATRSFPSYLQGEGRWVAEYWPARLATGGLVRIALTSTVTVVSAVLFAVEALGPARNQLLGIYGGVLFLSLGATVAVYAAWFLPSVHVVQERDHDDVAEDAHHD